MRLGTRRVITITITITSLGAIGTWRAIRAVTTTTAITSIRFGLHHD
jgi:hypothetical protein